MKTTFKTVDLVIEFSIESSEEDFVTVLIYNPMKNDEEVTEKYMSRSDVFQLLGKLSAFTENLED